MKTPDTTKPIFYISPQRVITRDGYYEEWAISRIGDMAIGPYFLRSKTAAERLSQELTTLARIKDVAANQWDASDQMDAIDEIISASTTPSP